MAPLFDTDSRTLGAPKNTLEADFFLPAPAARHRRTDNQVKNRFNSTLRRLFANQTKPAVDTAGAKKRKAAGADAGKSKRLRGSSSPKSSTDSDDDIITGLEQLVQASLQVERHASGGEESDDELEDKEHAKNNAGLKEAGESSVRGAQAFSDLASLAAKGFAGVPGISAAQMAATAAAFENYQKAAQAASSASQLYAASCVAASDQAAAMAKLRQPSFHSAQSEAPSTSTSAFPGVLAAFGGNAAAAAAANPLLASLVQAGNPAMMMGANQALVQRLLFEAQIKNAMAPAAINAGKAVPNGSEASDMSAHGGTAWAAAMAAMGPQFYAQMLGNPAIFSG